MSVDAVQTQSGAIAAPPWLLRSTTEHDMPPILAMLVALSLRIHQALRRRDVIEH